MSSSSSGSYSSYDSYSSDGSYESNESPQKTRTDDSPVILNTGTDDDRQQLNDTRPNYIETNELRTHIAYESNPLPEKEVVSGDNKGIIDEGIVLGGSDGAEEEGCIEIEAFDLADSRGGIKLTASMVGVGSFSETFDADFRPMSADSSSQPPSSNGNDIFRSRLPPSSGESPATQPAANLSPASPNGGSQSETSGTSASESGTSFTQPGTSPNNMTATSASASDSDSDSDSDQDSTNSPVIITTKKKNPSVLSPSSISGSSDSGEDNSFSFSPSRASPMLSPIKSTDLSYSFSPEKVNRSQDQLSPRSNAAYEGDDENYSPERRSLKDELDVPESDLKEGHIEGGESNKGDSRVVYVNSDDKSDSDYSSDSDDSSDDDNITTSERNRMNAKIDNMFSALSNGATNTAVKKEITVDTILNESSDEIEIEEDMTEEKKEEVLEESDKLAMQESEEENKKILDENKTEYDEEKGNGENQEESDEESDEESEEESDEESEEESDEESIGAKLDNMIDDIEEDDDEINDEIEANRRESNAVLGDDIEASRNEQVEQTNDENGNLDEENEIIERPMESISLQIDNMIDELDDEDESDDDSLSVYENPLDDDFKDKTDTFADILKKSIYVKPAKKKVWWALDSTDKKVFEFTTVKKVRDPQEVRWENWLSTQSERAEAGKKKEHESMKSLNVVATGAQEANTDLRLRLWWTRHLVDRKFGEQREKENSNPERSWLNQLNARERKPNLLLQDLTNIKSEILKQKAKEKVVEKRTWLIERDAKSLASEVDKPLEITEKIEQNKDENVQEKEGTGDEKFSSEAKIDKGKENTESTTSVSQKLLSTEEILIEAKKVVCSSFSKEEPSTSIDQEDSKTSDRPPVTFRDPQPVGLEKPVRRSYDEILEEYSLKKEKFDPRFTEPKPQLQELIEAAKGSQVSRRSNACGTLKVLASQKQNVIPLARSAGLLEVLVFVAGESLYGAEIESALSARIRATTTLAILAQPKENRRLLCEQPRLLEILVKVINEDIGEARLQACIIMAALAKTEENRYTMAEVEDIFTVLSKVVRGQIDEKGQLIVTEKIPPKESDDHSQESGASIEDKFATARLNCCAALLHLSKQCSVTVSTSMSLFNFIEIAYLKP